MQKADEQQLFVLPPGEEIPADEVLCLGAKLSAKAGKHPLSLGVSVGMSLTGYRVEVSRWGVHTAKGISCWAKLSNTQHRKPSKLLS